MARKNGILTPEEALEALGIQTAAGKPAAAPALTVTPGNALKSRAAAIITGSGGQTKGRGVTTRYGAAGHTAPLPAPSGRNELEIARSESRQLRQLGAGVSPETLAQREQTRQDRTYLPRAGERQPMAVTPSYEGMKQDIGMLMDRLEEQRAPLKEHLTALRKSTSDEWASMTAVQAETRRQTIGEIQDQIAALDRQEQQWMDEFYAAMDMEDKLDRGKYLAGLDRPLSDWEREEAKALAKELQTKPMEAVGAQLGGDTAAMRDQTQRNALASRLLSRSSASGAFGSGFVESFPGARRALESGQEAIRESGAYRQIFNDPEIAALMERGSAFEDAPEVSGGAYMAGMGAGDLSQIVTLNNLFGAGVRAVKPLSKLPGAVQNALTSGLTFGTKDAADVAGDGGSPEEIAKAGAVSFAGGAVGSGMADLVKLGGGRILTRYGAQNSIPLNILRDALSGTAFAGGSMGTRMALDEEYRPSGEEAAKDLAVSFAFSTLTSLLGTYGRTQADKARLQQYGEAMKQDYAAIVGGGNRQMTLDALNDLAAKSAQIRAELRNGTYLGQQKTVNGMLELLDALDDAVEKGRTQIYGSGLGAGASTHRMDALPGGAAGAALGSASDLATPPPASGPAMLPTAAELNSGTVGGLAAMANSQALGNLPRAGEVDRGAAGPYDGGKEADILEGGLRDGRESMGRVDRGGETGAVLRFETRFPGAGRETAAEGTPGAGGEAEGTGKISPFGGEILRGKELGGNDNRRTGGEVLWRSLQGTQPGGQGSYGNADRRPDEGTGGTERTEKAGGVIYTYRETPPERYSAGTLAALAEYRAFGLTPKVVDSFRRTVGSRTIESTDAVTGPDGTVYLLNDGTIPAKENAAHEALHVALRRELPSAVVYTGLVRDNIDLNDDTVQMYLSSIVAQYFDKHGRPFDSKDGMDELFEEFAAFMSGTMHDGSARDKFGAAIDDFDALEAAWLQMKQEMGAASAEPEYLPRAGEERENGLLPQAGQESGFSDVDRLSGGYINRTVPPEEVLQGIQDAAKLLPVAEISGEEFRKGEVDLITQVSAFFQSIGGSVENPQLGMVTLNRSGVGDDIAHGIGRKKAAAFAAVPAVLERGKVIDYQTNWKGRGYDTAVVAAPVTIGGEEYLEGIVLIRRNQTNRFYVHEVLMAENNEATPFKTGDSPRGEGLPGGAAPSVISLLRQVAAVKRQLAAEGFSDVRPLDGSAGLEAGQWDSVLGEDTLPDPESAVDGYWDSLLDEIERRAPAPQPGSEADADGYWDALLDWVTEQTEGFKPKTAEVSADRTPIELTAGEKAAEAWGYFKRKMVDAGDSVTRVGKVTGDKALYPYYNFARASTNAAEAMIAPGGAQTDIMGRKVGPSVADLWEPIRQKGEDYYISFQDYLFHRHNIDRMSRKDPMAASDAELRRQMFTETHPEIAYQTEDRLRRIVEEDGPDAVDAWEYLQLVREVNRAENRKNKPVFGWEVDADKSRDAVAVYEREHPEFKALAEQVYQFSRNLMQYRVDSGLLSREQADIIEAAYPHYVPAFRETARPANARNAKGVRVGRTVGRAEGGNANLMPLHIAMARQTMQVVREGAKNRFGMRLLDNAFGHEEKLKSLIRSTQEYEREVSPDSFDLPDDPTPQKTNTFTVYRDGKAWVMELDPGLYEGVKALSPEGGDGNVAVRAVRAANDLFKRLVTGYNPMFMARNFARDLQDAGLYSKDLGAWAQNYPLAVKEIISDGPFWRQYKALGGTYSSVFDYERGYRADRERGAVRRNTVDRVEALNMGIEQAPRLAEFIATVKNGGGDLDNLMEAMHNAAEVTVNFGRAGTLGKKLNQNFVPFLNPGIQGFDKMVRRLTGKKSGGEWAKLIIRCIALGVAPMVLNALLYRDDPEWEDIRDSDKDVNYLIKVGEGRWLKIPKGRDLSVLGMLTDRVGDTVRGEEVDWGDTLRTAANQIAPANPLENNIIAAWADADLFDAGSPGKTWYGGDIESQRLQGYAPGERYDERTDVFSKWLGGVLNLSPKKINYILDQYTGVVGDFVLPLLTPQAEQNPFEKSFVLDSVSSNKISGEFYDTGDGITFAKNGGDAPMSVVSRFWNRQSKAVSDIYGQIREIENSTELSDTEKREQVREAKAILNGIQKNAMEVLPAYEEAVRKHYTGDSDEEMDEAYLQANREVFGAEYALQVYNKQVYERAVSCDRQGVDFGDYFDVYFAMKDLETTNEKRDVLASADLTDEQKRVLYRDRITKDRDDDILASVVAGLPFNDFLEAQNVYTTLDKREGLSASERRTEFVRWMDGQLFTAGQREMLLEAFRFATWNPAQKTTYEKLMENGLDSAQAYAAAGGILGLEPLEGKSQVSAIQKGRVIVDGQGSDEQKVAALAAVLGDTEYAKLETAYQYDVSPEAYISYREALLEADDGNGSITQDEAKAAIDWLPLSTAQKAALWQLQNTSWKYWKNPYSGSVGRAVLEAYRNRPAGEAPQIQTRYGDGGPGGTGSGQVQIRYGGGTQTQTDSADVQTRYGDASAAAGAGQVQTRYGGVSPVMDRGQIQTRYGGAGATAQVAQKGSTLYQKVEMLPTAKDFIG